MYDFMYKNKGAISVFLVIVLVPMLVLSSVFVDMSRINLAKSVAESSGELSLNTALTSYDAVLKDMYGLFATAQDTDDLFESLEDYYRQSIESAGVSSPDAKKYTDQMMNYLKGFVAAETGTDDLLNMNLTSFEVTKSTDGSLANPAILKAQIVEFMKYRAPIGLGTEIFDAFGTLKNLKKQTELVEKKNDFYKEQASMMKTLQEVWTALESYQYRDAGSKLYNSNSPLDPSFHFPDETSYAAEMKNRMDYYAEGVNDATHYAMWYLYYADPTYYKQPQAIDIKFEDNTANGGKKEWTIGGKNCSIDNPNSKNGNVNTVKAKLEIVFEKYETLKKIQQEMQSKMPSDPSDSEKIYYVSIVNKSGYSQALYGYLEALIDLQNEYNMCDTEEMEKYYVVKNENMGKIRIIDSNTEEGKKVASDTPKLGKSVNDELTKLRENDNDIIITCEECIQQAKDYYAYTSELVDAAIVCATESLKNAHQYAVAFNGFLDEKIGKLDEAIKKLNKVEADLQNPESEYNKALAAWKSSADGLSGDTLGENDKSEIEKLEKVLTLDKVEELITRIEAAKESLESVQKEIGEYRIGKREWTSDRFPTTAEGLVTALKADWHLENNESFIPNPSAEKENDVPMGATYRVPKAYNLYTNIINSPKTGNIQTNWEESKSPDLTKEQVGLYTWLYSNFDGKNASEKYKGRDIIDVFAEIKTSNDNDIVETPTKEISTSEADEVRENIDKAAEEQNSNEQPEKSTDPNRPVEPSLLPSGQHNSSTSGLNSDLNTEKGSDEMLEDSGSALGEFDRLFDMLTGMATTLRDDMYVCNYIMNMFSYSTYEAELTVKNGGTFTGSWYEEKEGKYDLKDSLKNNDSIKTAREQAKTLTKEYIEPNKNYLYGREVEYIIYGAGKDGTSDPRTSAYGTIYMLRFALNTVYAFMDTEISNVTNAAATALFGTPPLTPLIPVARIAMTLGFALAESAYDLYQLKSGVEVPLMKNKTTWVMRPSNGLKALAGEAVSIIAKEGTNLLAEKGYEVLSDIIDMTDEELTEKLNGSQEWIYNLAEAAIDSTVGEINNQCGQVLNELVSICNHVNDMVKAETDESKGEVEAKVEEAEELLDEWLKKQENNGDIVYKVKAEAVDLLKENNGNLIKEVFDLIDKAATTPAEKVANAATELSEKLGQIKDEIETKVESTITAVRGSIDALQDKAVLQLKAAAGDGVESLRNELNKQIDNIFGTSSSKETGAQSVVSSLTSWAYSDYLQLFLLVGIVSDSDAILLRTADVIELNMQQITGEIGFTLVDNEDQETGYSRFFETLKKWFTGKDNSKVAKENENAFKLSKAYTYLNVKAVIEVKPMMMTLPLIANTVKSQLTGTDWYQITYSGNLGY